MRHVIEVRRRAAPAPDRPDTPRPSNRLEAEVHNRCREWASWTRTRGFFGAPRQVGSIMESLVTVKGGGEGPNARCDPALAAFHLAVVQAATDEQSRVARMMFEAQFLNQRNVSRLAEAIGVSRTHWYRTVNAFARRAYADHLALQQFYLGTGY